MAGKMPAPPNLTWEQQWKREEKAEMAAKEKARDVNFTTRGNPLATLTTPEQAFSQNRIRQNMRALRDDAERRADPRNGIIYAGIMDMRYGG